MNDITLQQMKIMRVFRGGERRLVYKYMIKLLRMDPWEQFQNTKENYDKRPQDIVVYN